MFPIFIWLFVHFTDQKRMDKNTKTVIPSHLKLLYAQNFTEIRLKSKRIFFLGLILCGHFFTDFFAFLVSELCFTCSNNLWFVTVKDLDKKNHLSDFYLHVMEQFTSMIFICMSWRQEIQGQQRNRTGTGTERGTRQDMTRTGHTC